jgi:hypothetical protein
MITAERYGSLLNGKPGALIDEDISIEGKSRLIYTYHDENGYLFCILDFPRNATPEDIAQALNRDSEDLLHDMDVPLTEKEVVSRAKVFRELATKVPGLKYRK